MVFIIVWILPLNHKILFFEICMIKLFLQYFLTNNAIKIQISSLLMKFGCFFQIYVTAGQQTYTRNRVLGAVAEAKEAASSAVAAGKEAASFEVLT